MPFVRIDALRADPERLNALGRAVHEALIEAIGIPTDDHFQILVGHDGVNSTLRHGTYLGVQRDDGIVYVAITMRAGRTSEQKQALYRRIAELAEAYAGTEPRNVFVTVTENASADWSLGNGEAQYLATPSPSALTATLGTVRRLVGKLWPASTEASKGAQRDAQGAAGHGGEQWLRPGDRRGRGRRR